MVIASPSLADAETFTGLLWRPGDVREVRILRAGRSRRSTHSGYFDDPALIGPAIARYDGTVNIYITVNPVVPALLARAANRIVEGAETTTSDADILARRWIPIDIDPRRPAGISATDDEVAAARDVARSVAEHLRQRGLGYPVTALSGNGYLQLVPVDLPNDRDSDELVAAFLRDLAARFDDEHAKVDTSVANAGRIVCLVGTRKVKGDPTEDRPHRRSVLVHVPDDLVTAPLERLVAVAPARSDPSTIAMDGTGLPTGWVRRWLDEAGVSYKEQQPDAVGIVWYGLESCPYHPDDGVPWQCGVGEAPDGHAAGKCFHDRGADRTWHDFRRDLGLGPRAGPDERGGEGGETAGEGQPEDEPVLEPPDLARSPRILDEAADTVARLGVAGERQVVRLLYLVVVTRLLDRIVSAAVKGTSSAGKSWLVSAVLRLFPASAYHELSAFSERALIYDDAPLRHRMLVIYEAAGMAGELQTYIMRSLLSEGRVRYTTVEKGKGGLRPRTIEREGPTGLITTTTDVRLHPENETRLLSITISDTPEQTRSILVAQALGPGEPVDFGPWHDLQRWLAGTSSAVTIPYLVTLARAIPPVTVRLRRDFPAITALIGAHALLHRLSRDQDATGAVVATIEDYAVVRDLVADLIADAAERAVPESVRETVEQVATLTLGGGETTVLAVAKALGIDKSAASRRVRSAIERGYVKNLEDRRGRPAKLVPGDPLPAEQVILPEAAELERLHGCSADEGDTAGDGAAAGQPDAGPVEDKRDGAPSDERGTARPMSTDQLGRDTPSDEAATVQPSPSTVSADRTEPPADAPRTERSDDLAAEAELAFAELGGAWVEPTVHDGAQEPLSP